MNTNVWSSLPFPLSLSRDVVHVVRLKLDVDASQIEVLRRVLSDDELVRADRFKFSEPRSRFIVCRAALRCLMGHVLECDPATIRFSYGSHGKPQWAGRENSTETPIEFSVSHSADLALIAIALERRVGVDLEHHDHKVRIHKLAARFFSQRESSELSSLAPEKQLAGFYRGWTCKEAFLKATGFGLAFPLSQFSVAMNPDEPARLIEVLSDRDDSPSNLARLPRLRVDEATYWSMHSLDVAAQFSAALLVEADCSEEVRIERRDLTHPFLGDVPSSGC
jgi:4'-phosphopantetheinyl transferase